MAFKIHLITLCSVFCLSCMEQRDYLTKKEKKQIKDIVAEELDPFYEDVAFKKDIQHIFRRNLQPLSDAFHDSFYGFYANCQCLTTDKEKDTEQDSQETTSVEPNEPKLEDNQHSGGADEEKTTQVSEEAVTTELIENEEEQKTDEEKTTQVSEEENSPEEAVIAELIEVIAELIENEEEQKKEQWVQGVGSNKESAQENAIKKCIVADPIWNDADCG